MTDMTDRRLAEALLATYERARRSVGIVEAFDAVSAEARRLLGHAPDKMRQLVGSSQARTELCSYLKARDEMSTAERLCLDGNGIAKRIDMFEAAIRAEVFAGGAQVRDGEPAKTGRSCPLLPEHEGEEV